MKIFAGYVAGVMIGAVLWITAASLAQDKKGNPPPTSPPKADGRIVVQPRESLHRFEQPQRQAPANAPSHRYDGHHWRWHPSHGWVLVPVTVSPNVIVLEPGYQLPAQVMTYQSLGGCVCPHCGRPIVLSPG